MLQKTLLTQYEFTLGALKRNVEGVTHAESVAAPAAGGSSLNWVVGHVLLSRNGVLAHLGEKPVAPEERRGIYGRGSRLDDPAQAVELGRLLEELGRTQEGVRAGFARLSDEDCRRATKGLFEDESTVGVELGLLAFHEAYHVGQTGVLRRAAGKPGAIA